MTWKIEYARSVQKTVKKLDPQAQQRIRAYMEQRVALLDDPREIGEPLKGQLAGLWRYRVGDYRVICQLRDSALVVLVVRIGQPKGGMSITPLSAPSSTTQRQRRQAGPRPCLSVNLVDDRCPSKTCITSGR